MPVTTQRLDPEFLDWSIYNPDTPEVDHCLLAFSGLDREFQIDLDSRFPLPARHSADDHWSEILDKPIRIRNSGSESSYRQDTDRPGILHPHIQRPFGPCIGCHRTEGPTFWRVRLRGDTTIPNERCWSCRLGDTARKDLPEARRIFQNNILQVEKLGYSTSVADIEALTQELEQKAAKGPRARRRDSQTSRKDQDASSSASSSSTSVTTSPVAQRLSMDRVPRPDSSVSSAGVLQPHSTNKPDTSRQYAIDPRTNLPVNKAFDSAIAKIPWQSSSGTTIKLLPALGPKAMIAPQANMVASPQEKSKDTSKASSHHRGRGDKGNPSPLAKSPQKSKDTTKGPSHQKEKGHSGSATSPKTRTPMRSAEGQEDARPARAPFTIQRTLSTAHDESGDSSYASSQDRRGLDADHDIPVVPDPNPTPARQSPTYSPIQRTTPATTTPATSAGQKRPAPDDDDAQASARATKQLCDALATLAASYEQDAPLHAPAFRAEINRVLGRMRDALDEDVKDQQETDALAQREAALHRRRAELAEEDAAVALMKEAQERRKAARAPRLFG